MNVSVMIFRSYTQSKLSRTSLSINEMYLQSQYYSEVYGDDKIAVKINVVNIGFSTSRYETNRFKCTIKMKNFILSNT